tara:strand:+ start:91 stop:777 length:687 start_codon:yes stop_codon:yes gene_type:complete
MILIQPNVELVYFILTTFPMKSLGKRNHTHRHNKDALTQGGTKKDRPYEQHNNGLHAPGITVTTKKETSDGSKKTNTYKNDGCQVTITNLASGKVIQKMFISFCLFSRRLHIIWVVKIMKFLSSRIDEFNLSQYFVLPKVLLYTDDFILFERAEGLRLDSVELGHIEYSLAVKALKKAIKFINSIKVYHNDLNLTNLFWDPEKKLLTIIDWDELTLNSPRPKSNHWKK